MSHTVRIVPKLSDVTAMQAAAARLELPELEVGQFSVGDRAVNGVRITLADRTSCIVCDTDSGEIISESPEAKNQLGSSLFQQAYAIEKIRTEARRMGCAILEEPQASGAVRVTLFWRNPPCDDLN